MRACVLALVLGALVTGCSSDTSAPAAGAADGETSEVIVVDGVCPISGEAVDEAVTVDYQGKTVKFCCKDCLASWEKMTDEEKQAKLAAAEAKLNK
ncbi:hypothetical protein KOR34_47310 [Posidoniimonas corsicana]|uniref:TRASH domain-containing protein n=1 Tax=Posidoniimonas corsicana TaxID=1938618 RepID=A0A5C5UX10_9BACT|nr:hypothetical protein [Posidoniimonas corsicana]TWT30173.1 hypothetical protein KOR34_47310 [Posidoniimonas corsicana]